MGDDGESPSVTTPDEARPVDAWALGFESRLFPHTMKTLEKLGMKRLLILPVALAAFANLASASPAGNWRRTATYYVPFNTSCTREQFGFFDNYHFYGSPQYYSWPNGDLYPCASFIARDDNGCSLARAVVTSIGDMLTGSATANGACGYVSSSMVGAAYYQEVLQYFGDCRPWAYQITGFARMAALVNDNNHAFAAGWAELWTTLTAYTTVTAQTSAQQLLNLQRVDAPPAFAFTGYYSFRESTDGQVSAWSNNAATWRAELREEVFVRTALGESCPRAQLPGIQPELWSPVH